MVLGGWVSSQLWLVSNKIVWLFGFLCLEFNGWVVWQGWTKRTNNNILRWSKLPWMQLLFRRDDSYSLHSSLWDILPLINFLKLRSRDCHVRPCYVCNEHPDVLWMVQPGGAKEKLRGTRETSRHKMETSLIKGAKIAKNVCFWKVITPVFLGLWTTKKSWKSLRYAFPHPSICLHHHVICSWTLDEIEQNIICPKTNKNIFLPSKWLQIYIERYHWMKYKTKTLD